LALLTTKTLKFKPSLLASVILLLSCEAIGDLHLGEVQIDTCKLISDNCSFYQFTQCVKTFQEFWIEIQTSNSSRHDAINSKYTNQELINLKEVKIPLFEVGRLKEWHSKIIKTDSEGSDPESMQTDN